jgi:hypothetical protein
MRASLLTHSIVVGLQIADACKIVLRLSGQFLSSVTIRDILIREGYDLSSQANALASVHAIMKRMKTSGEADEQVVEGKTLYRFRSRTDEEALRRFADTRRKENSLQAMAKDLEDKK